MTHDQLLVLITAVNKTAIDEGYYYVTNCLTLLKT